MASYNLSDTLSRKMYLAALRSLANKRPVVTNYTNFMQLAGLSTYDKPAAPTLEENQFYDKYKEKLNKLKQEKPTEFRDALDKVYKEEKTTTSGEGSSDVTGSSMLKRMKQTSKDTPSANPQAAKAETKERPDLNSFVKLDLLQSKTPAEISAIWSEYFASKAGVIYATIPAEKYRRLQSKGNVCPLFVYAVPREAGYEFILGQCSADDWYYTPLIAYQTHGEYAPYSLTVRHYTELLETKGVVLMKGEIASEDLKPELATLLVHQTQLMYGSDENFKLVEQMNKTPDQYNHMSIIEISKKFGLF